MRCRSSLSLMKTTGLIVSVIFISGCKTTPTIEPYEGVPFFESMDRLEEYEALACKGKPDTCVPQAPKIRAWIREADRTIRSNNALRSEP